VRARWSLVGLVVAVCLLAAIDARASDELPRKGQLGIRVLPVPEPVRVREKLKPGEGVVVDAVVPDTTASRGGLKAGDIVVTLDGRAIDGVAGFLQAVPRMKVGQRFVLGLVRDGRRTTATLTLAERFRDRGATFDVLYRHVRSNGARIRTILTRPHAPGPHPAFVLLQGLGPSTIDEPLAGPSAYSRIVNAFAEAGYVTVRVEKPGIGDSEGGPYADVDFASELDIYRQALHAVMAMDEVDRDRVFVFGHSIGGVFAPLLAAEMPVRGIAVYGTVVKPWTEYVLENTRRQAMLAGSTRTSIEETLRALGVILQDVLVDGKTTADVARQRPELRPVLHRLFPDGRLYGRSLRVWSQVARTDLPAAWTKVSGDVLALWGRHDFVSTEGDHARIAAITKGTYAAIDGADHGFRQTASIEDSFRRWTTPVAEVNAGVITALKTWTDKVRHAR
jgi:alpha-beta hydrolase superfamily lysophospholipase